MYRAQEPLCESQSGASWAPVPNRPTVSVDVKQHFNKKYTELRKCVKIGGRSGLLVTSKPSGFCGRKTLWKKKKKC